MRADSALTTHTDNVRLLIELNEMGLLSDSQQYGLEKAYKVYRQASHHAALAEKPVMIE